MIARRGKVYKLVDEECVAWHAGKSTLRGCSVGNSCNDFSIGIELIGNGTKDFTNSQYDSLVKLTRDIRSRHTIPKENIVGHSDIAPGRKVDPGPHFDWGRYIGELFPKAPIPATESHKEAPLEIQEKSSNISDGRGSKSWFSSMATWFSSLWGRFS